MLYLAEKAKFVGLAEGTGNLNLNPFPFCSFVASIVLIPRNCCGKRRVWGWIILKLRMLALSNGWIWSLHFVSNRTLYRTSPWELKCLGHDSCGTVELLLKLFMVVSICCSNHLGSDLGIS